MVNSAGITREQVWDWLQQVTDPEIPVLTIHDLGILRDVAVHDGGQVEVFITPTYNGCPAMDMIAANIRIALAEQGITQLKITSVLAPAWTTDWMTEEGKKKLCDYGIAAPDKRFTIANDGVECPHCHSTHTKLLSEFGSTACKALYQCNDCKEPFDYFKCH
ncbi:MAG TPA: phenylacetate-CoA oxygenase subunit PaaJ [Lacibacter sp.]|nr:phenylacetate-CoA oxygenase subunit PaaJ [Lacibacter sp.]HMO88553.1 phenylacetate-CoA oxygenase subunit PaaJ [Lacibacter sp.]